MGAALAVAGSAVVVAGLMKVYEALKLITLVVTRNPLVAIASALLALGVGAASYLGLAGKIGDSTDENTDKVKKQDEAVQQTSRSQEGYNKKIQDTKDKLSLVAAELKKNLGYIQDKLVKEYEYLGLTTDEVKVAQQKADIDKATADAKYNLEKQYQALAIEEQTATKAHHKQVLADLDDQGKKAKDNAERQMKATQELANLYKQLQDIANVAGNSQKTVFEAQTKFAISRISGINDEINATAKVNAITDLRANLLSRVSQLAESDRAKAITAINDITTNTDYLTGSFADVSTAMKAAFANYDLGASKSKTLALLTKEPFDEFQKGANKVAAVNKQISDQSRTFADGWQMAFKDYARAASDSAALASSLFKKFTQGIEDNLVTLIKGGKADWKGFVAGLGEELLRNQIKQGISSVLGSIGDALKDQGGLLGSIGKFFGIGGSSGGGADGKSESSALWVRTAGSGSSIFGPTDPTSQGSGIFDTVKGVFNKITDGVGSVFSGISDTVGSIFGGIGDAVGSIFGGGGGGGGGFGDILGSIGSLFGFAKGGLVPTNGPVLVGENGPEILSNAGGQTVSPLGGGGSTNVTYNINAVDAASFKQMIAADPGFIHAVAQQGSRGVPRRY